jgi:predicted small secreted protein
MTAKRLAPLVALSLLLTACPTALGLGGGVRVTPHEGRIGDRHSHEVGHDLEVRRLDATQYPPTKPGVRIVTSQRGWALYWSEMQPEAAHPPPLPEVDFGKEMLLLATGEPQGLELETTGALRSERGVVHVYLRERLPGDGCKPVARKAPVLEVAAIALGGEDVHVWIDRELEDSCGADPTAVVGCRIAGTAGAFESKVTAAPGQTIDCDGSKSVPAKLPIVDHSWGLEAIPSGSTTKLTIAKGGRSASFPVDAYGTYTLRHDVTDAEANSGGSHATVVVVPPADVTTVQLGWTKFDRTDDPDSFPRIELHATELPGKRDCALPAGPQTPPFCTPTGTAFVTHMQLRPAEKKSYALSVKYVDDRYVKAPIACLRVFPRGGKPPVETCDDDVTRKAGTSWEPGVLDFETGAIVPPPKK